MTELTINEIYAIGAPIVLAMILFEVVFSSVNNKNLYKKDDTLCTIGLLAGNILMVFAIKGITLALHFYLFQFKLINLSEIMPIWTLWLVTFVMIDLVFYIYHRISHRVNFLWAIHMSHHSSEEMNFTVSLRQAWFGPITKVPFFIVMPLIGFDPIITAVAGVASTLWGVIGHTQWIRRLGILEYILVTPSSHRVHHGSNECYIDKNYGNLLIVWDRLFGTFAEEIEPVKFGIRDNVKTYNPIKITFMFWGQMIHDFKKSTNTRGKLLSFFGRPEWKP